MGPVDDGQFRCGIIWQTASAQMEGISMIRYSTMSPQPNDVLLGRGKAVQRHPGNANFLRTIDEWWSLYHTCERGDKRQIVANVIDWVHSRSGRFIKHEPCGYWVEVSLKTAQAKVAQALRHRRLVHMASKAINPPNAGTQARTTATSLLRYVQPKSAEKREDSLSQSNWDQQHPLNSTSAMRPTTESEDPLLSLEGKNDDLNNTSSMADCDSLASSTSGDFDILLNDLSQTEDASVVLLSNEEILLALQRDEARV